MYHVYLNQGLVCIYSFISSIFFSQIQNIKFLVTLFCEAYKVETWYTHGPRIDLLCTPNTSSQNILVPLFFFFFLSLQLAKIKKLHLQNCFSLPLMATAGGMWAMLTLCYIFPFPCSDDRIWARVQKHLPNDIMGQERLRSDCTSAHSGLHLLPFG